MKRLVPAARRVLERQLDALKTGTAPRRPQDQTQATYFGGRKPEDGRIDWRQPARRVVDLVRAVARPYPGAFTEVAGSRIMVWSARLAAPGRAGRPGEVLNIRPLIVAAGEGAVELVETQGAEAGTARLKPGEVLG
jgi:methionyl-tRNA formyltransferase